MSSVCNYLEKAVQWITTDEGETFHKGFILYAAYCVKMETERANHISTIACTLLGLRSFFIVLRLQGPLR